MGQGWRAGRAPCVHGCCAAPALGLVPSTETVPAAVAASVLLLLGRGTRWSGWCAEVVL